MIKSKSGAALLFIFCAAGVVSVSAQENAWTKSTNGFWDERFWSLGILPNSNQYLEITNAGSKVITINSNTVFNSPQTMTVRSLVIAAPSNSYNHLYLRGAGLQRPLASEFITIRSNSAMTVLSSAVRLTGGPGEGMVVGGQVHQNPGSWVTGQQVDVGSPGAGIYNLNGGLLDVHHFWLGGSHGATFNHNGGTNKAGILHLYDGAIYNLKGGVLDATLYFDAYDAVLYQRGGRINKSVTIQYGMYVLENGICSGVVVPTGNSYQIHSGSGTVVQTGGTNLGGISVGGPGTGHYILSNGVSMGSGIWLGASGRFDHYGGTQALSGGITMTGDSIAREVWSWGAYVLHGGSLVLGGGIDMSGSYVQRGGSCHVAGDIYVRTTIGYGESLVLEGGVLAENNLTIERGVLQRGGTHTIKSNLTVYGYGSDDVTQSRTNFALIGGSLQVSNIILRAGSMGISQGTLAHSGTFVLGTGTLWPGAGVHRLGVLQLDTRNPKTNSTLALPNGNCVVRFAASSHVPWATDATLTIVHWGGSFAGKGLHQVIFGTDLLALTRQQVSRILFVNPGQLTGTFRANILPNGEVVPELVLQARRTGNQLLLEWVQGYHLQTAPEPTGPWIDLPTATSSLSVDFNMPKQFFRLKEGQYQ